MMIALLAISVFAALGLMAWGVVGLREAPDPMTDLEDFADRNAAELEAMVEQMKLTNARMREQVLGIQVFEARQNAPTSLTLQ